MYVYRLEDPEGNGPFAKEQAICTYLSQHNDPTEKHMLDSIRHTRKQFDAESHRYIFGWSSQKKARAFVKAGKRNVVAMLGWRINCYRVYKHSTMRFHDGQVMFRRERAELVKTISVV